MRLEHRASTPDSQNSIRMPMQGSGKLVVNYDQVNSHKSAHNTTPARGHDNNCSKRFIKSNKIFRELITELD